MRALHMSFRLYGNDEMCMNYKEMTQSFQENNVSIPGSLLKSLTVKFESKRGIDLEGMYRFLSEAHNNTGRDSVLARHTRNDLAPRSDVSQEEVDEDLLWRVEAQLVQMRENMDISELRMEFQARDHGKAASATVPKQVGMSNTTEKSGSATVESISENQDQQDSWQNSTLPASANNDDPLNSEPYIKFPAKQNGTNDLSINESSLPSKETKAMVENDVLSEKDNKIDEKKNTIANNGKKAGGKTAQANKKADTKDSTEVVTVKN
ncbi:hypothetical protein MAR_033744, partial [Mya arenaria]